jgi:hypothetical protein
MLRGAGLSDVRVHVGASKAGDPFAVLIASGVKTQMANPKAQIPKPKSQSTSKRYA